jgi:signal transduction histidine kinase/CheY-like chemotaxis protein
VTASFPVDRVDGLLGSLERMAAGELDVRVPISGAHDHLDAVAHSVNVLVGELQYASAKLALARDEANAANEAKTAFLRNVSHDIRTPLSAILSITRLLQSPDLTPDRRLALYDRILSNGDALMVLVDDLLDLSKLDAQTLSFELRPMPMLEVVAGVVANLEPAAQTKGLRLLVGGDDPFRLAAMADPNRVRQILANVIGNAIKFTERGRIRARVVPDGEGHVAVEVTDTGLGMTSEQVAVVFQPFTQADPSIATRFGGSGLGLALSRRLARAMGGDLLVRNSAPGVGTTMCLRLPAHDAPPAQTRSLPSAATRLLDLQGLRLLLAEDNADIRQAMTELIARLEGEVVAVCDGREAVEQASDGAFDVLLMDVRMPGMDGLEATRLLRARGFSRPIIALTGDAVSEHRTECIAAGCSAYVTKPVNFAKLIHLIRELCPSRPDVQGSMCGLLPVPGTEPSVARSPSA